MKFVQITFLLLFLLCGINAQSQSTVVITVPNCANVTQFNTSKPIIFCTADNNLYIWNGTTWQIYGGGGSGAVDSVNGQTGVVVLTKADIGLGNADNTSDANKPISTATQTALDAKQNTLVSGTNIKTVAGNSLLGAGNVVITKSDISLANVDNTSDANKPVSTATQTALNTKLTAASNLSDLVNVATAKTNLSLVKTDVGLANVDNTSDLNKPISTATQSVLDLKAPLASPTFTGTVSGVTKTMVGLGNVANIDTTNATNVTSGTLDGDRLPSLSTTKRGGVPATGTPSGKFLKDDGTWTTVAGGGDLLAANNLSDLQNIPTAKANLSLNNVDNTSDANKPISTATQTAIDAKVDENVPITGATNTKITYDAKGLVTAGVAATTADINDSTNRRYVTDAQLTVIGNTSGTNTGDQTNITGNAGTATALQTARTINGVSFNGTANITIPDNFGYTLSVQALTSSPADAATIHFGQLPKAPTTTAAISKVFIRKAGAIKIANIYCFSGTAGTAESWSLFIRVNNTTDTLIAAVASATSERVFVNTALNITVNVGDYFEIKAVNPTWVTNPSTTIFGGYVYIE